MAQDYYQVLGVERDATAQEVKKAYRKKARELHPDHNPSEEAAEQFKTVTHAYEVLSNTEKRRNYDATGHEDGRRAGFGGAGAGGFSDIFETFFGGGGGGGPMSRARRGQDALIATHIELTLPQARVLDLTPFRARPGAPAARPSGFNEAFG